ncbi:MAG: hypothetical protein DHS20C19_03570 [Acidimicrobiales bacterium]|nr:MAG: hypothetical protein DHS20C19_03570 [Acidimicrobiales bacterium]
MAGLEKNLHHLSEHLVDGEAVTAAVLGNYETTVMGQDSSRNGIFAATDRRIVLFAKKLGGYDLESFPYKSITSIETSKGMTGHVIALSASGKSVKMKYINKGDVAGFVNSVRQRVGVEQPAAGVADELGKPASLRDSGMISDDEWERATALYLGKPLSARDESVAQLRKLHSLHREGVLSESEFNSKKWEVLARPD